MPKYSERLPAHHTPAQMYDLVLDIGKYPEFLPWCTGMRIRHHERMGEHDQITADMMVAFKAVREKFTSQVNAHRDKRTIEIDYLEGPFKYLHNTWSFQEQEDGSCVIEFFIDFEFKSLALRLLINKVFDEAVRRMVSAFIKRADALYGS